MNSKSHCHCHSIVVVVVVVVASGRGLRRDGAEGGGEMGCLGASTRKAPMQETREACTSARGIRA